MERKRNEEYIIIASTLFSCNNGFALGESEDLPVRYVTWQFNRRKSSDTYYCSHYFTGEDAKEKAIADYEERIAEHQRKYPVEIKERMTVYGKTVSREGVSCTLETPMVARHAQTLRATVTLELMLRDGETEEQAKERLYDLMYDGLCRTADHHCDFTIEESALKE